MKKVITIISVLALIFAFTSAYAAGNARGSSMSGTSTIPNNLTEMKVKNNQGESLGKVSDVVRDPQTNQVSFVMISGDVLGTADKLIPVPVNAFTFSGDNAVLNMSKSQLAQAPSYDMNNLPDISDRAKYDQTYRYFGVAPQWDQNEKNLDSKGSSGYPLKNW